MRRLLLWLGLNLPRTRPGQFGTFGLSVYSSLGAESLAPALAADHDPQLRRHRPRRRRSRSGSIYDHRVMDGATVARALARLEDVLTGPILDELQAMVSATAGRGVAARWGRP